MHDEDTFDHDDNLNEPKSRSALKRESESLQDLGTVLVKMSASDLAKVPMPDPLAEAVRHARSIRSHSALRRQMQYIGKLMRQVDAGPIREAVDSIRQFGQQSAADFHRIERWRDRLLAEGDDALATFINEYPHAERQRLRQLVVNATKERNQNQPPKSARTLFRYLRELVEHPAE